jgi:hypothetical protein
MRPYSGAPPGGNDAAAPRAESRGGGEEVFRGVRWANRHRNGSAKSASAASAILGQIAAIIAHAKENHDIRLQVRCAFRDGVAELEQARVVAGERFLASRRSRR